jgi:hypothetical protein
MYSKKIFWLLICILFSVNLIFAQENNISIYGRVTDAMTRQPIPFANILIVGTNYGAASDNEGYYQIEKFLLIPIKSSISNWL